MNEHYLSALFTGRWSTLGYYYTLHKHLTDTEIGTLRYYYNLNVLDI